MAKQMFERLFVKFYCNFHIRNEIIEWFEVESRSSSFFELFLQVPLVVCINQKINNSSNNSKLIVKFKMSIMKEK